MRSPKVLDAAYPGLDPTSGSLARPSLPDPAPAGQGRPALSLARPRPDRLPQGQTEEVLARQADGKGGSREGLGPDPLSPASGHATPPYRSSPTRRGPRRKCPAACSEPFVVPEQARAGSPLAQATKRTKPPSPSASPHHRCARWPPGRQHLGRALDGRPATRLGVGFGQYRRHYREHIRRKGLRSYELRNYIDLGCRRLPPVYSTRAILMAETGIMHSQP
jgi:hypothetical protein